MCFLLLGKENVAPEVRALADCANCAGMELSADLVPITGGEVEIPLTQDDEVLCSVMDGVAMGGEVMAGGGEEEGEERMEEPSVEEQEAANAAESAPEEWEQEVFDPYVSEKSISDR